VAEDLSRGEKGETWSKTAGRSGGSLCVTSATATSAAGPGSDVPLCELLTVMHGGPTRRTSCELEVCDRLELGSVQPRQSGPGTTRPQSMSARPEESAHHSHVSRRRIWFDGPERFRVELIEDDGLVRCEVRNAGCWWYWDRKSGLVNGGHGAPATPRNRPPRPPTLLLPAEFLAMFWVAPLGRGMSLGREVLVAAGTRRFAPDGVPSKHRLEVDAEHGTILRQAAYLAGHRVHTSEVLSVRFDAEIDRDRFACPPIRGGPSRSL
jgi:hypothetical protein